MALYESNYLRLLYLIPELERLDGCYRSRVAGECDLYVEILERCRYTVTLSMTYLFVSAGKDVADPDLTVRAYLDGQLAESMSLYDHQRQGGLHRQLQGSRPELHVRWQRNVVLNKWLEYLTDQGHLVLDR
ncbi:MAG: DUF1249 domain-containing protein [Proteobacteria bacterium]|nr:DUF1249 domain-containing protein [Pseudomonadota bacterium]